MVIYKYPFADSEYLPPCVLALGFFDGVHIAHRDLLSAAKDVAKSRGLKFGIFTFLTEGGIKSSTPKIYDDKEKADLFSSLGADFTVFADFASISHLTPEEFVRRVLGLRLNCRVCVAGFNFTFGSGASGKAEDLCSLMARDGGTAIIREEIKSADGKTVSASLIRELINDGKISEANSLLGRPFGISGRVLHGKALGRQMGFPTANLEIGGDRIIPRLGVYASAVKVNGNFYLGVTNVGICPTFDQRSIHYETNIIDFEGDIYDETITVFLLKFIRDEKPFSDINQLKMQINVDKNTVINEYGDKKWQELGLK